ncbi:MAG: hypothetical protein MRZ74_13395 [Blautia sp.]|nr:hypothetical protein [Blautia sp.]MDY5032312.1 hypothetical protein [Blautia sp.]
MSEKKKRRRKKSSVNPGALLRPEILRYVVAAIAVVVVLILIITGVKSCGVKQDSPEKAVQSLVKAGVKGKTKDMAKCFGAGKEVPEDIQKEIDATVKYYKAHDPAKVKIVDCGVLTQSKKQSYVYITYNLVLQNEQEYPCIGTYMVQQEDDGKYYVIPASQITEEMSRTAAESYSDFMKESAYKTYTKAYDAFMKKNPGYEDKIADKVR